MSEPRDPKKKREKKSPAERGPAGGSPTGGGPSLVKNLERYRKIFKRAKELPTIDLKKVNRLREAIRQGRYEADFEKLAEKLLKDL